MITPRHILRRLRRLDWLMVVAVGMLMAIGVLFIYSACYRSEDVPVTGFYQKQLIWCAIGLLSFLVVALTDYHRLRDAAWPLYFLALVLLGVVLALGVRIHGAARWLNVFGLYVQPSELGKLASIIALARYLSRPGRNLADPRHIAAVLLLAGLPFLLIVKEPDLGTAAVLLPVALVMMFIAGVPARALGVLMLVGVMLLPVGWFALDTYQKERLLVFFDPGRDPLGSGWNKIQSEIAVGSGGLTGKGYLKGTQNVLGFLPRSVAPTDFIYSVIAEETGFVGSTLTIALYGAILLAGMRAALRARDKFGRLLAAGAVTMIFSHVFVNIAMTVGLMPITGLPLPLISYGGSFMIGTMLALGMVQSVYRQRSTH